MKSGGHNIFHAFLTTAILVPLFATGVWRFVQLSQADVTQTVTISATVLGCGDGIIQLGETCDTSNMNGHTCATEGFVSGSISCQANCTLNTSSCSMSAQRTGQSSTVVPVSTSTLTFTGYAYPGSPVTVLRDGQRVATVSADAIGEFFYRISNQSNGTYSFSFSTEDSVGNRSALTTRSVNAGGGSQEIGNIFLSPTISPITTALAFGDAVTLTGQATPNANVTVRVYSPSGTQISSVLIDADSEGAYSVTLPGNIFTASGTYSTDVIAERYALMSTVSLPVEMPIGEDPVVYMKGDYNENWKVNLVDFSIALYWYKEPFSDAFKVLEVRHGNGDGKLDLIDISILAYWWTG